MRMTRPLPYFALLVLATSLSAALAPPARAQAQLSRIELVNSTVKAERQTSVPGMALRFHFSGGDLDNNVSIVPAVEYWRDVDEVNNPFLRLTQRDWNLGSDVRYTFNIGRSWRPYAGAGLWLHLLHSSREERGQPTSFENHRKFAPDLIAGVDLPSASFIQSSIDVSYHMVSDLKQLKVNWGIGVKI